MPRTAFPIIAVPPKPTGSEAHSNSKRQLFTYPKVTFSENLASEILERLRSFRHRRDFEPIGSLWFTNQHGKSSIKRGPFLWSTTGSANTRAGETAPFKALIAACSCCHNSSSCLHFSSLQVRWSADRRIPKALRLPCPMRRFQSSSMGIRRAGLVE